MKVTPIRLVDEKGENVGIVETQKALKMAQDKELDLVEVAPNVKPPVCKILSWSKFKYELSKRQKGSSKGKAKEMKEMRFTPFTSGGDIDHKLKRVREFLSKKHPVKLTIRVKGRVLFDAVKAQLDKILKLLKGECELEGGPRKEGRNLSILILPSKSAPKKEIKSSKKKK
ncbi:translation initiation factor IF-3 [Patescibacteria group bacterium]